MSLLKKLSILISLPLVLALNGCGSSSATDGGIGGTGVSVGEITQIGSITVNGVKFDTTNAEIYMDGARVDDPTLPDGDEAGLRGFGFSEGQLVRVEGTINDDGVSGAADRVVFDNSIKGPVEGLTTSMGANTYGLVVMRQSVIIDDQTVLIDTNISEVASGIDNALVAVSGLTDANGVIHAGYFKLIKPSFVSNFDNVEIRGIVESPTTSEFKINALAINYTNAGSLSAGQFVEVEGTYDSAGTLLAQSVSVENDFGTDNADDVELEGIVTDTSNLPTSFRVSNHLVVTNAQTKFKSGTAAEIAVGVHIEVEGSLIGGTIYAEEVSFEDGVEIESKVATVDQGTKTLTLVGLDDGTHVITVQANDLTKYEGVTNFTAIDTSHWAIIRGRAGPSTGEVIATEIKVETYNTQDKVMLQGPLTDPVPDGDFISILGFPIDTTLVSEFEGTDDNVLTQIEFVNAIKSKDVVDANGDLSGSSINWTKLEIEDDE